MSKFSRNRNPWANIAFAVFLILFGCYPLIADLLFDRGYLPDPFPVNLSEGPFGNWVNSHHTTIIIVSSLTLICIGIYSWWRSGWQKLTIYDIPPFWLIYVPLGALGIYLLYS